MTTLRQTVAVAVATLTLFFMGQVLLNLLPAIPNASAAPLLLPR